MRRHDLMRIHAKSAQEAQEELDELKRDYWKADRLDRVRLDVKASGARALLSYARGALDVLIDLHVDEDDSGTPVQDRLTAEDVIAAFRCEADGAYSVFLSRGGTLSLDAFTRYRAEHDRLYELDGDCWSALDEDVFSTLRVWLYED